MTDKPDKPKKPDGRRNNGAYGGEHTTKLTAKLADSIIDSVKAGLFDAQNALKHGIDLTTLKSWVDRGIDEEAVEPFRDFAERYIKAAIALEEGVIGTILKAADQYQRFLESVEEYEGPGDCDSSDADTDMPSLGSRYLNRKRKRETAQMRGDWRAAAWYAERRWPLRWGITRQPEGGPKEAIKLPDAPVQRRRKVEQMVKAPPPELIKALRDAGFELVRREKTS
jgi:hypothetical protein